MVTPSVPDTPVVALQPPVVGVSANQASSYIATLSAAKTTPTGNYVVMVWARSGTISHLYSAILMVDDYRPPPDDTPPSNVTTTVSTTSPTGGSANSQLSPGSGLAQAADVLRSLSWLEIAVGVVFLTLFLKAGRQLRRNWRRAHTGTQTELYAEP